MDPLERSQRNVFLGPALLRYVRRNLFSDPADDRCHAAKASLALGVDQSAHLRTGAGGELALGFSTSGFSSDSLSGR